MGLRGVIENLNYKIGRAIPNWARLLFPIILGAVIIYIVVTIMYFGGKRESLSARAEATMIRWALSIAAKPADPSNKVLTISVTDDDLPALERAPHLLLVDAHIREYAAVLEQVAASEPAWIVVSWLTYAHPVTPEYLKPLTDVIDRLNIRNKTTLAVNLYASGTIQQEFMTAYNIVEARDCYYDVNSFCTVSSEWTWMPQQVMNRFFRDPKPWDVSTNLPHTLPNVLLNLPTASSVVQHSFLDFRPPVMTEVAKDSVVFIGNNTSQALHFRDNKDALQKTFSASSKPRRTLLKDGMPWHVFWASMASMFIDNQTVAVAPDWVDVIAIIIVALAIIFAIKALGGAALAPFFVCAIGLPIANIIGVSAFRVYMPAMPVIIAGMVVFTAAIFITVAYSSYTKWRLQAAEKLAESTADIKENFIHLISHNLNTPVAQLRGLLEVLNAESSTDDQLGRAYRLLEYVRIIVQCVLNTTTMASQPLALSENSFRSFIYDLRENQFGFFRRAGVSLLITPDEADEQHGEIWFFKFTFDRNLVSAAVIYAAILIHLRNQAFKLNLNFRPVQDEPADPQGLILSIQSDSSSQKPLPHDPEFSINAIWRFLRSLESRQVIRIEDRGAEGLTLVFPTES